MSQGVTARHCPTCDRFYRADTDRCPRDGSPLGAADARVGDVIDGRYTILERIGRGVFGTVYRARQHTVSRDVALKLVPPNVDEDTGHKIMREARLAGQLNQPLIVAMLDFGRSASTGEYYLVMEYVPGPTLADVLAKEGAFESQRAIHVAVQLCDALEGAHRLNIIHRNLKPSNIKLRDEPPWKDAIKILDFGLARTLGDAATALVALPEISPCVAPEAMLGHVSDGRADLFSVGAIVYEMLAGRPPFATGSMEQAVLRPRPPNINGVSPALNAVVMRLLEPKKEDRFPDAAQTREAFLAVAHPELEAASSSGGHALAPDGDSVTLEMSATYVNLANLLKPEGGATAPSAPADPYPSPVIVPAAPGRPNGTNGAFDEPSGNSIQIDHSLLMGLTSPRHSEPVKIRAIWQDPSKPPSDSDDLVGYEIDGRYHVLERIGAGGFGVVYRARQSVVDRDVAIKVISPNLINDDVAAQRFLREAQLSGQLSHANVVGTLDFGRTERDHYYIVMEYVRGKTLRELMNVEQRFEVSRAVRIALQIAEALAAAHVLDIVHRDLKPSNVMILDEPAGKDFVKILDYGLAKSLRDPAGLTGQNTVFGTPGYMSPEMVLTRKCDARGDMYSLGIILYEMLAGGTPFAASKTVFEVLRAHVYTEPPPLPPEVPPALSAVIMRLLAKEPEQRYARAADIHASLLATGVAGLELTTGSRPALTPDSMATQPEMAVLSHSAATELDLQQRRAQSLPPPPVMAVELTGHQEVWGIAPPSSPLQAGLQIDPAPTAGPPSAPTVSTARVHPPAPATAPAAAPTAATRSVPLGTVILLMLLTLLLGFGANALLSRPSGEITVEAVEQDDREGP